MVVVQSAIFNLGSMKYLAQQVKEFFKLAELL